MTKAIDTTHISGWISLILPLHDLDQRPTMMKPAPMPTLIS